MATLLAKATFKGRMFADGFVWKRICADCEKQQPDQNRVNDSCKCGGPCVWVHREYEDKGKAQ